jgi:L-ascorbate metabolism protein UlaG (beta-lactamase superfamily)
LQTEIDKMKQITIAQTSHPEIKPKKVIGDGDTSIYFVGTATTILEHKGFRIMTDPNFLHSGDHVHLGPGVTGTRKTDPAIELEDTKADIVLLSHYHEDHFDKVVEESLRRDLPIITTPHAKSCLEPKGFNQVTELEPFESVSVNGIKITGTPGQHAPVGTQTVNQILGAIPPTNGWLIEIQDFKIYITGDTLMVDELKEIPKFAGKVNIMLIHLGGTTIPPEVPILMVTMDAKQGLELVDLINPDVTIPIHYE